MVGYDFMRVKINGKKKSKLEFGIIIEKLTKGNSRSAPHFALNIN
jgi:hypothetical protein